MDTASLIAEIKSLPAHDVRCERILVAIDGSHASFHAAAWAIELGRRTGAELTVLMVVDYDAHVSAFEQVSTSGYLPAELKISAYRLLAELMHEIPHNVRAHRHGNARLRHVRAHCLWQRVLVRQQTRALSRISQQITFNGVLTRS